MKKRIESLDAWYHPPQGAPAHLGRLGVSAKGKIALEVDAPDLLQSLSPLTMRPREHRVIYPAYGEDQSKAFQGLFGLFADSLPDSFGMEVVRRKLGARGFAAGPLEILAYLGEWGRGAIHYEPSLPASDGGGLFDIGELFERSLRVQDGERLDLDDPMAHAMGTAGGTRPKAFVVIRENGELRALRSMTAELQPGESSWMVKFDCTGYFKGRIDHETRVEAAYLHAARQAGIDVPEFQGLVVNDRFHLATRRFDRTARGTPLHAHTLWGLLQAPTGSELASYDSLVRAAIRITQDSRTAEQVFRRLAFNILAVNRDDHPKQHAFLFDGRDWSLAPAYDLTFSERAFGQSMPVLGSVNPNRKTLMKFAGEYDVRNASSVFDEVVAAVRSIPETLLDRYEVPKQQKIDIAASLEMSTKEFSQG